LNSEEAQTHMKKVVTGVTNDNVTPTERFGITNTTHKLLIYSSPSQTVARGGLVAGRGLTPII